MDKIPLHPVALGIAVEALSHTVGPKAQLRAQNPLKDHGYTWTERKEKCPDLGEFLDSGIRESLFTLEESQEIQARRHQSDMQNCGIPKVTLAVLHLVSFPALD